jgi:hypothetical protein
MPAHDEALKDLSSMPPVSVTMQARYLADVAAEPVDELVAALDVLLDEAELWLLPHAAMTSVAATATAAVAHALCFTLTSTGPARHSAPGLPFVLGCPAGYAGWSATGKGESGYLTCSLPNRNPIMISFLA